MKKLLVLSILLISSVLSAQNFSTFGLSSNPENIVQNPGADPMTRFQLRYFAVQSNVVSTINAGELFATSDLLGNIVNSGVSSVGVLGAANIYAPHLGFKIGKNYFFTGAQADIDFGLELDADLAQFMKYGMADANGNFDGNYTGDFSDTRIGLNVTSSTYYGYQRTLMDDKLRVGLTYSRNEYVAGFNLEASNFELQSTANPNVGNTLSFGYDLDIASTNLFSGATLDSLSDINGDNFTLLDRMQNDATGTLTTGITLNTFGFGITYRVLPFLETSLSITGLGANTLDFNAESSKVWSGSTTIDGFEYTSAPGDSISVKVSEVFDGYTNELGNGFSTELTDGSYKQSLSVAQNTNFTINAYLNKRSYVGMHYTSKTNSYSDYEYLGFTSQLFLARNLQIKGGYYFALDEFNSDIVNIAIQARVTPLLQVYVGSNTVSDAATFANGYMKNGAITLGRETRGVNVSAGLSLTLFDKRFKQERKERKEERKAKKAEKQKEEKKEEKKSS